MIAPTFRPIRSTVPSHNKMNNSYAISICLRLIDLGLSMDISRTLLLPDVAGITPFCKFTALVPMQSLTPNDHSPFHQRAVFAFRRCFKILSSDEAYKEVKMLPLRGPRLIAVTLFFPGDDCLYLAHEPRGLM